MISLTGFPTFFFHGALGIGDFSSLSPLFRSLSLHVIAPTLPGWGLSSPIPNRSLLQWSDDVIALAEHLSIPNDASFDVMGISLGAIHAIACAATIPQRVRRTLAISGHAPFTDPHFDPMEGMDSLSSFGLSSFCASFTLLNRMGGWWVRRQCESEQGAKDFVREFLFLPMDAEENARFSALSPEMQSAIHSRIATNVRLSLQHHLSGYTEIPSLLRSLPHTLLSQIPHGGAQILFTSGLGDRIVPHSHHRYYLSRLSSSSSITYPGGHMMSVLLLEKIVKRFVEWEWTGDRREEVLDESN